MAAAKQDQDIIIHIARNFKNVSVSVPKLKKLVEAVYNRFARHKAQNRRYEISIAIVDDTQIQELNSQFLNRNATTDCLSFDLSDDEKESELRNSRILELVVNGEMAVRQANLRGHPSEAELALYITHGLLHNLGFDDSTQSQARKMHETEDEILQQFGYGLVYNKGVRTQEY
ncbi:MAG: rRNA maturation RNase YbeY [Phycisphaerales bacterium]|jgi:probable rRNA maturation factor